MRQFSTQVTCGGDCYGHARLRQDSQQSNSLRFVEQRELKVTSLTCSIKGQIILFNRGRRK